MTLSITEECISCWACEPVCPNGAIVVKKEVFRINNNLCTQCEGHEERPQCVEVCPVEGAIINMQGVAMNPPGSLTGIQPTAHPC
ncbi:MAG: 4Fe-4S binding protein [Magnetococcales bacterium]|nr:4Fe-4S binding protein [Magnetococcales bacterium]NGZ25911.1 4Fe-4S binding protein [Magnetococcales bacterium]